MPAMLDDPTAPTIHRTSGPSPHPSPHDPLPAEILPCQVTLRDRLTTATIVPFSSAAGIPHSLVAYLSDQLNREIEGGDTYPMMEGMSAEKFGAYWFQNFGAIMFLGNIERAEDIKEGKDWSKECLGSFYIKPNYPGRSSHVCNAGFLVTEAARNRGVGRLMGETYLSWAPHLGYTYSVFNLVYETNVASCRIWDALGFKRIGRVKGAGNLKSYPNQYVDAIIYGRDLGPEGEDLVSEERFDKIKFYLKFAKYPNGADRAEKSRLRSAATHYKLLDGDKLMLKDKEVVSDPQRQYEIAKNVHATQHGGINKTTATIAEKYHWVRIKETVSLVIKNCTECKDAGKVANVKETPTPKRMDSSESTNTSSTNTISAVSTSLGIPPQPQPQHQSSQTSQSSQGFGDPAISPQELGAAQPSRISPIAPMLDQHHSAMQSSQEHLPHTIQAQEQQHFPPPQPQEQHLPHIQPLQSPPEHQIPHQISPQEQQYTHTLQPQQGPPHLTHLQSQEHIPQLQHQTSFTYHQPQQQQQQPLAQQQLSQLHLQQSFSTTISLDPIDPQIMPTPLHHNTPIFSGSHDHNMQPHSHTLSHSVNPNMPPHDHNIQQSNLFAHHAMSGHLMTDPNQMAQNQMAHDAAAGYQIMDQSEDLDMLMGDGVETRGFGNGGDVHRL